MTGPAVPSGRLWCRVHLRPRWRCFSFSTFLGVLYYARGNVAYLCGDNWWSQTVYKLIALAMLVIGGMQAYTVVWDLGDVGIG